MSPSGGRYARNRRPGATFRFLRAVMRLAVLVASASALSFALSPAYAADEPGEVAESTLEMAPIKGKLYKEKRVPVEWRVQAEINEPSPDQDKVRPLKKIKAGFPTEMAFVPAKALPVCSDRVLGPDSHFLGIPAVEMIKKCPKSLVGNGRVTLYLAMNKTLPLDSGELVIFYGGRKRDGTPRIKVYGYEPFVRAGVYMEGTWIDNVLEVDIPKLPFDSATASFEMAIPGRGNGFPGRVGRDPGFVRASCPNGFWEGTSEFLLGERLDTGEPSGEEVLIRAPDFRSECTGLDGAPTLKLKATGKVKSRARRSVLTTVVTNSGTATARKVEVRVGGRGVRRSSLIPVIPSLAPGASRRFSTVVTLARNGRARVRITASGQGMRQVVLIRKVRTR